MNPIATKLITTMSNQIILGILSLAVITDGSMKGAAVNVKQLTLFTESVIKPNASENKVILNM